MAELVFFFLIEASDLDLWSCSISFLRLASDNRFELIYQDAKLLLGILKKGAALIPGYHLQPSSSSGSISIYYFDNFVSPFPSDTE